MARINFVSSVGSSSKQMQQTSGSSVCRCSDGDEAVDDCFVVVSLLSLSLSFLSLSPCILVCCSCGGVDEVVVVVDVFFLSVSLAFFVAVFSCTNRWCPS